MEVALSLKSHGIITQVPYVNVEIMQVPTNEGWSQIIICVSAGKVVGAAATRASVILEVMV